MMEIDSFILAGGASRRMGRDKAHLVLDGHTLLHRISNTLFAVTESVTVVGRQANESRLASVSDVYPNWGALGGLHAALNACKTEWAIVVACDLPFITTDLILCLMSLMNEYSAVIPLQQDGRPQPLCGLYRIDPCRDVAGKLIETEHRRPLDLLEAVSTRWVSFSELEDLPQSERFFVNINTPADYEGAAGL
ncbi:MAG: molybdenum cofactor guanylyltransferase [Pyrinomonadaceae bacterium]